jgi:ABC-type phosphate/phosphonate transport system ATPase subunit|tara:strand:- start:6609 stop:7040 length:432 start_codon:yes stop_codon:yes gene_type:complete
MVSNNINKWEKYLTTDDYVYLVQYIENIKNGMSNDTMIILVGPGRSGKSTLKKDIHSYLGDELCGLYCMSDARDIIYDETIKPLVFFDGIDEIYKNKKTVQTVLNFIKYKQSFIADTQNMERVNNKLIERSKIIRMTHVFNEK